MTRGKRAKAIWVSAVQVMLSKVIYNVAVVHVQLKSQKLEYIRPSSNKNLSKYFQVIVTLNYFALFKEVLPCMFVISVPSQKHFNL